MTACFCSDGQRGTAWAKLVWPVVPGLCSVISSTISFMPTTSLAIPLLDELMPAWPGPFSSRSTSLSSTGAGIETGTAIKSKLKQENLESVVSGVDLGQLFVNRRYLVEACRHPGPLTVKSWLAASAKLVSSTRWKAPVAKLRALSINT